MFKLFIKNNYFMWIFSLLILIIGYAFSIMSFVIVGLILIIYLLFSTIISFIRLLIFLKKEDKTKLHNDLKNCLYKFDNIYFTNDYIFSFKTFEKIYYKNIVVVEKRFSIGLGHNNLYDEYILYLKNDKMFIIYKSFFELSPDKIVSILKAKNSNIYYGKYKEYIKSKN